MIKVFVLLVFAVGAIITVQLNQQTKVQAAVQQKIAATQPIELGDVAWLRDLETARAQANAEDKPLLILFQEVPGCSNCTRFGSVTLTHPLIVEAIETFFVPVCIYNNGKGKDAEALRLFHEPAWNNPVVRIVNTKNEDLTERMANFKSQAEIVQGMTKTLDRLGRETPKWLQLVEAELVARERGTKTATFSMHCFWVGEGIFGAIDGVVATKAGWQDGREVVQIEYDPTVTNEARLSQVAQANRFEYCSNNTGFRIDKEPKYYLSKSPWRFVPMTACQASRANNLAGQGADIRTVLSPRQIALGKRFETHPDKQRKSQIECPDFTQAWKVASAH